MEAFLYVVVHAIFGGSIAGLSFKFGAHSAAQDMKKDAVERGFAEYDQKTGEWKWKEKSE